MKFKNKFIALCAVALLGLGLASCGSSNDDTSTIETETQNTVEPTGETTQTTGETTIPYTPAPIPEKLTSESIYVKKVEGIDGDFIRGMDASSVLSLEAGGTKYYDFNGKEEDVFKVLADNGINYIRVRVWNDPFDAEGHGYGGGNCDINTALEIGKRANKYGMKLLVNFHYSDFWADPSKQMLPKAWKGMTLEQKQVALYNYTKESLQLLKDNNIDVGMVQIGNETNQKLAGEKTWKGVCYLFREGSKATREVYPDALVALHFTNPEGVTNGAPRHVDYASKLDYYSVDYDVFGTSYYPYWHGTLENLTNSLNTIAEKYNKKVMVLETSYAQSVEDTDFYGNTIGDGGGVVKNYPCTQQGQVNCMVDIAQAVANATNGIGLFYWEGTWITAGGSSWEENSAKWEQYGSGWAASYASEYDPDDAGLYYGGCAVDNQAFFDATGHPLESLKVWNLMFHGNNIAKKADAIEDVTLINDLNVPVVLPDKVNAIMNDNSKEQVAVTWNVTAAEIAAYNTNGVNKYTITGTAGGMEAKLYLSMVEFNFLENYSFEGSGAPWVFTDKIGNIDELLYEDKASDSLTGTGHGHFWADKTKNIDATIEQTVNNLPAGKYKFGISIMGSDHNPDNSNIYAYVKVNGVEVATAPLVMTYYNEWHSCTTAPFEVKAGDVVTVGINIGLSPASSGNGAWGKIDDGLLNSVTE